jgi:pimeloyl-ACP methyl ester carboxylesterase
MILDRLLSVACALLLALASLLIEPAIARAETPILETNQPNGDFGLFEDAPYVPDPWFMWFVLGHLSSPDDVDMAKLDYKAGDRFKAEMFIAAHEELRDFNPNIALIGPGLPQPTEPLPFEVPPGMGVIVARGGSTFDYHDIFTQMIYWPRAKIDITMPATGRYYVATWGQPVGMARYALDIGVMESFAPAVIGRYPINWWEVRDFLRWGHWPAVLVPPAIALSIVLLLRKRLQRQTFEALASMLGLVSIAIMVVLIINAQQYDSGIELTGMLIAGAVAVTLVGSLVWGAYLFTPVREKLNLREFSNDDHFAWVDGYAIHFSDAGPHDAPVLVLIHGFGSSVFTWRNVQSTALAQGFRVVAVDLLGSGASSRPAEPIYTTEMQARFVMGVMDKLGIERAQIGGHSYGGRVALQMAVLAPARVQSLALISPEAFATERPGIARLVRAPFFGYILTFYSTSPLLVREGLRFVTRQHGWLTPENVKGYAAPLHVRGTALSQVWQARSPKDGLKPVPNNLSEVASPALVLWGEHDPVFPVSDAARLAGTLQQVETQVISVAGHIAHEECPDETIAAMISFYRRQLLSGQKEMNGQKEPINQNG